MLFAGIILSLVLQYAVTEKPNIVIIVADDMGWNDVGFHGSEIPTPNIDALAYNGVILNRHYTLPCCTPSRASLLTGKYASRIGMQGRPIAASAPLGLNPKEKIMPQYFKELGYSTHLVGKWHVGYYTPAHLPTNRGFDSFFGYLNGYLGYYDGTHHDNNMSGLDAWRDTSKAWQEFYGKYLTTMVSDEAVNLIHKHASAGRKDGLFLVVASPATHKGNRDFHLEPPPVTHGDRMSNISDSNRRIYADVVMTLDDTVGDVTAALKSNNMINNSIIIFLADNGAPTTDNFWHYSNDGSNWPLKGEKMSVHEGGVRTAAAVWSSSFMKSKVHHGLFHISDWLPTLYAAAGGNLTHLSDLDGINQWASLKYGKEVNNVRTELLVDLEDVNNIEAIIKGQWKLLRNHRPNNSMAFSDDYFGMNLRGSIEYNKTEIYKSKVGLSLTESNLEDSTIERLRKEATISQTCTDKEREESQSNDCHTKYCLYDIEADPCECKDLAASKLQIVQELSSVLDKHRQQLVKRAKFQLDQNGFPGVSNYWEPWMTNEASINTISKLLGGLFIGLLRYL